MSLLAAGKTGIQILFMAGQQISALPGLLMMFCLKIWHAVCHTHRYGLGYS